MSDTPAENQTTPVIDENQLIAERRSKLKALREAQAQGKGVAFPNDFKPEDRAEPLTLAHGEKAAEALKGDGVTPVMAKIAGRMMLK
ncbi:MAG: lysine--tRNA ligase, partial [Limnohabitans sp.]